MGIDEGLKRVRKTVCWPSRDERGTERCFTQMREAEVRVNYWVVYCDWMFQSFDAKSISHANYPYDGHHITYNMHNMCTGIIMPTESYDTHLSTLRRVGIGPKG